MGTVDSVQKSPSPDHQDSGTGGVGEIRGSAPEEVVPVGGSTGKDDGLAEFEMNGVSSLLKMKESNRRGVQGGDRVENLDSLLGGMDVDDKGGGVERELDGAGTRDGENGGGSLRVGDGDLNSDGIAEDVFEHQYSVGDFVWGKIKNHPWWPGQVYDPSDASEYAVKHWTSSNKILVAYFGDGTFAWCHPSQLKPFEENFEAFSKQSASRNFTNSISVALDEICRVVSLRISCPCVPPRPEASSIGRKLAVNSGIKEGAFVPDAGIEKLTVSQLRTSELVSNLRKMACTPSASSALYSAVVRNWLILFYKLKGVSQLPSYYEPVTIPGLEDRGDSVVDGTGNAGVQLQGPVMEESQSAAQKESMLKKCAGTSGEEPCSRRKEKSILEILGLNGDGADNKASTKKTEDEHAMVETNEVGSVTANEDASGRAVVEVKRRGRKKKALAGAENGGSEIKVSSEGPATEVGLITTDADASATAVVEVKRRGRKKKALAGAENGGSEIKVSSEGTATREAKADVSDGDRGDPDKGSYLRERKKSKYLSPPFTNVTKGRKRKDKEPDSSNVSGITRVAEKMKRAADHLMGTPPIFEKKVDVKVSEIPDQAGDEISEHGFSNPTEEERYMIAKTEELKASAIDVLNEVRDAALDPNQAKEACTVSDDVEMFLPLYRSSVFRNGSNYKNFNKGKLGRKREVPETDPPSTSEVAQINQSFDTKPQKEATEEVPPNYAESPKKRATEVVVAQKPDGEPRRKKKKLDAKLQKKQVTDEVPPKSDSKPRKNESQEAGPKSNTKPRKKKATGDAPTPKSMSTPKSRLLGKAAAKDDIGWLLVTFKQASSLPTKEDLITMYCKYGKLDENETVVHYNSKYALVVFEKISDAEEALKCSQVASPFGSSKIEFELLRANSTPYGPEEQKTGVPRKRGRPRKTPAATVGETSTVTGDTSGVQSMKRKLESISSLLDKSGGKLSRKVKSQLRGEIKGLLDLVGPSTDGSASS